ncbi:hypothetical protein BGZ92_006203 [Podila epicladia]|nr:hypothetical protein BGZ92_006203 [Podila epicladia]
MSSLSERTRTPGLPSSPPPPPQRALSPEELIAQTNLLDDLMTDIGMGKFQKQLLVLCGLGWFADNVKNLCFLDLITGFSIMWHVVATISRFTIFDQQKKCIALILPRVQSQFEIQDKYIGILSSSMFVGMMFGAMFWGMLADAYGRKQAFNLTLIVTTLFGVAASFANSYWLLCLLILGLGFGVGGNMPVDGALFLEFTPKKNQYLLTFLSIFFSFGAVSTALLGYFLLPPYSCEDPVPGGCQGKGWRYMLLSMGACTFSMVVGRVLLFRMEESPKFLLNHNRHQEAAMVLTRIFHVNHKDIHSDSFEENIETLTTRFTKPNSPGNTSGESSSESDSGGASPTEFNALRRPPSHLRQLSNGGSSIHETKYHPLSLHKYRNKWYRKYRTAVNRLKPLLEPKFRVSTILIWIIWAMVAFAYTAFNVFYPKFLQEHGQGGKQPLHVVYRDTLIYAAAGVPGSVLATFMIEGRLGRRYTMAISTFGTAIATILFAVLSDHTALTIFSAILSLLSTLNYAVLYSYTPEVFPSDIRGTACGVAAAMSRLAGILSPLLMGYLLSINTSIPLYVSFAAFAISGVLMCFLPIETRGRAAE